MTRTNREEYTIFFCISGPICVGTRFRNFPWPNFQLRGRVAFIRGSSFPSLSPLSPKLEDSRFGLFTKTIYGDSNPTFEFCRRLTVPAHFTLWKSARFSRNSRKFWTPAALVRGSRISLSQILVGSGFRNSAPRRLGLRCQGLGRVGEWFCSAAAGRLDRGSPRTGRPVALCGLNPSALPSGFY